MYIAEQLQPLASTYEWEGEGLNQCGGRTSCSISSPEVSYHYAAGRIQEVSKNLRQNCPATARMRYSLQIVFTFSVLSVPSSSRSTHRSRLIAFPHVHGGNCLSAHTDCKGAT